MIVDSSALVAIIRGEDDAELYEDAILSNPGQQSLSAATFFETAIVI